MLREFESEHAVLQGFVKLHGCARVHQVTKPVRRCYLSSLPVRAAAFSKSFFPRAAMADAGTDPVESRSDEHGWGETRPDAVSSATAQVQGSGAGLLQCQGVGGVPVRRCSRGRAA